MKLKKTAFLVTVVFLLSAFIMAGCGGSQEPAGNGDSEAWKPESPINVLVQYSAGGSTDITARIVCKNAEEELGQPVVVVNKPGGGGSLAHTELVNAKPDGYTLLLANVPNMLTDKKLVKGITYDINSFKPIAMFAADPILLIVRKGSELDKPLAEFAEYVKARPGKVLFGNPGQWAINDFSREIIQEALGIQFQRIPYGGGADAVKALLAGEVDVITTFYGDARAHIESGSFSVLAVADENRLEYLPDVPTFKEAGYDVVVTSWRVLVAPKDTPDEITQYLHDAFKASLDDPKTAEELQKTGVKKLYMGPEECASFLQEEYEKYNEIIERLGLEAQ